MTFDDELNTLSQMFETWDKQTLAEIFQGNDHHMERTIECILSMESGGDIDSPQDSGSARQQSGGENLLDYGYDSEPTPITAVQSSSRSGSQVIGNPGTSQDNYRGMKCHLPDDFLRPPGYTTSLADEQLALMLQDEMFRREVATAIGANGLPSPARRSPGQPQQSQYPQGAPPDVTDAIMKGLATMGEGMKKQLSALATSFNTQRRRYVNDNDTARNPLNRDTDSENVPLTHIYKEEEEEVDSGEVINFDNSPSVNRGGHSLNDFDTSAPRKALVGGISKKDK